MLIEARLLTPDTGADLFKTPSQIVELAMKGMVPDDFLITAFGEASRRFDQAIQVRGPAECPEENSPEYGAKSPGRGPPRCR